MKNYTKLFLALLASVAVVSAEDLVYRKDLICNDVNVACGTELEPIYTADQILDRATEEKLNSLFNHYVVTYGEVSEVSVPDPLGARNAINDKLIALIEYARSQFSVGFPSAGVPPIDPFYYAHKDFLVHVKILIKIVVNFDNIYASGLKNFVIHKLDFQMVGLTLFFDFSLNELAARSTYRINGKILGFPYNPKGDARVTLSGIRVTGVVNLGIQNNHLTVKAFKLGFDLKKVKLFMSGLLGNGIINKFFNWILSKVSEAKIQEYKNEIIAFASHNIKELANVYLENVSLSDLVG